MNPAILTYLLRLTAVGIQIKSSGLTDDLREQLALLVTEAKDSILEPQESGEPWTDDAILAWKAAHDQNLSEISARHGGPDGVR